MPIKKTLGAELANDLFEIAPRSDLNTFGRVSEHPAQILGPVSPVAPVILQHLDQPLGRGVCEAVDDPLSALCHCLHSSIGSWRTAASKDLCSTHRKGRS